MENIPGNYAEALEFLYEKLPMFSRIGDAAIKKDLTNIRLLCEALGNPQNRFKSIHIAGTNGKGSVSHSLAAVLQQAGYKTGLYTSPHLKDFRERIRVNGKMIAEDHVTAFIQTHHDLILKIMPSFFEITVAMAFDWFAKNKCKVAVVEVGLGGRLDSTNILLPEISVITNISLDHQYILGNTLAEIAGEKAGIIKENIPVVVGETQEQTIPVFLQKAAACHAPIIFADQEWKVVKAIYGIQELTISVEHISSNEQKRALKNYTLDLTGSYQEKNICTTLAALYVLQQRHWHIREEDIKAGLAEVKLKTGLRGRWEMIGTSPLIIADVAHNEAGIREVMHSVDMIDFNKLHIVTGFVKDKAIGDILPLFPKKAQYYFCQVAMPRALPSEELRRMAKEYGLTGKAFPDVQMAFREAKKSALPGDMILICGSVFITAEILP